MNHRNYRFPGTGFPRTSGTNDRLSDSAEEHSDWQLVIRRGLGRFQTVTSGHEAVGTLCKLFTGATPETDPGACLNAPRLANGGIYLYISPCFPTPIYPYPSLCRSTPIYQRLPLLVNPHLPTPPPTGLQRRLSRGLNAPRLTNGGIYLYISPCFPTPIYL
ncbi:unnamed protein product [Boreogadus saida]